MAATPTKKLVNLNPNILLEYEYNSAIISENYSVWSDLSKGTRNFVSTTNYNDINHNLFQVDPVLKKYAKIDPSKFNFLKVQNYFTAPVTYDRVRLYLPNNYNFDVYFGFLLNFYSYDYYNKKQYWFSNYFFDKTDIKIINGTQEYAEFLINLGQPFLYNGKEWGKYIEFFIPSLQDVSNQRDINTNVNRVTPDSINDHLTNGVGLSTNNPIFVEFSFLVSKTNSFGTDYYFLGDTAKLSLSRQPEYQTLGVTVQESTNWDFFEIFGTYNNSNENLDNFVNDLENQGKKINIEYVVTLFEENLVSGFPTTFLVTENFAQKIEYRPIIKYSNTTAAIDVEMRVMDLVDNSSISRFASIGLTSNLLKYGKKLAMLDVSTVTKPKIYNYKADKIMNFGSSAPNTTNLNVVKVSYPILVNNYKILASNFANSQGDYKSMGTLNIILTPFDNVMKFQIAKQDSANAPIVPYDLSQIMLNSKLSLVFKSDTKMIEKDIYYQSGDNNFPMGIVVFKVNQEDIPTLKQMVKTNSDNFYIILNANNVKSLLYSGKFKIFENIKFIDIQQSTILPLTTSGTTSGTTSTTTNTGTTTQIENTPPPQFDANGIPVINPNSRGQLDYYRNLVVYAKQNLTNTQLTTLKNEIDSIGTLSYYHNGAFVVSRVKVEDIQILQRDTKVDVVYQMKLDFGWTKKTNTTQNITNTISLSNNNTSSA
jgi:hypothetical protein